MANLQVSCDYESNVREGSKHKPITGIIGGFHLLKQNRQLTETVRFLKDNTKGTLYPCHCVSLEAKFEMMKTLPVAEVGVGLKLEVYAAEEN